MAIIEILDPTARPAQIIAGAAPLLADLRGKAVALVSNEWPSLATVWEAVAGLLRERGAVETPKYQVPLTRAASPELLSQVAARCQAAVVALGN
ncbi:MAG: hypothetical protein Q8O76_06265 [Chloroflexota bacterium]|nr:hypothetical protein [Chloroflexota bacterium]